MREVPVALVRGMLPVLLPVPLVQVLVWQSQEWRAHVSCGMYAFP